MWVTTDSELKTLIIDQVCYEFDFEDVEEELVG